ncbi:hypothetical protein Vafri_2538 [Volvox africanus]|uniref:Uncharacterized protein n=1 Tax=Volvox africanus TaxID=51714 RepID=A0A8J4ESQ1_9CHLO|nr:hypothetical protein Vafri_2538 [Volvox africanus]
MQHPRCIYNLVVLWIVAGTVMAPYVVQLVRRDFYERHREWLMLTCQGINALVYTAFASGVLTMPPELKFHWNHSHVLQRGVVRPIRRPVRFRTHMRMLVLEVLTVTPAFLAFSSLRRVATTTLVTYSLSAAVGYALDLAMRRLFLLSLVRDDMRSVDQGGGRKDY